MKERKVGVEIETTRGFFFAGEQPDSDFNVRSAAQIRQAWSSKYDGSLPGEGVEFVSRPLEVTEVGYWIPRLIRFLKSNGTETGEEAGIHVHVGLEGFKEEEFSNLMKVLWKVQRPMYQIGGTERLYNRYCKASSFIDLSFLNMNDRYRGFNFQALKKHGTLEFRMHEGSLDEQRIVNWAILCWTLVETAFVGVELPGDDESSEDYLRRICPFDLRDWLEERMDGSEELCLFSYYQDDNDYSSWYMDVTRMLDKAFSTFTGDVSKDKALFNQAIKDSFSSDDNLSRDGFQLVGQLYRQYDGTGVFLAERETFLWLSERRHSCLWLIRLASIEVLSQVKEEVQGHLSVQIEMELEDRGVSL